MADDRRPARTVVGAGAVVVRDLPPNVVAVGNPARRPRALTGRNEVPSLHPGIGALVAPDWRLRW